VGTSNKEGFALNNYRHVCGKCGARRIDAQLGLEATPGEYVAKMVEVFREVKRVLRWDGSLWLNLGSSYAGGGRGGNPEESKFRKQATNAGSLIDPTPIPPGFKPKDLIPIPWMVAMALQKDGWWLRDEIVWAKDNPMPESTTDRCTKAHEKIFMLTKSAHYFYDNIAIQEPISASYADDKRPHGVLRQRFYPNSKYVKEGMLELDKSEFPNGERALTRNRRNVWRINTQAYADAHFATFPEEIPKICILAGTSARGCCPKCGAPWERCIERSRTFDHETYRDGKTMDGPYAKQAEIRNDVLPITKATGWQPGCPHSLDPVPCTVLDPFFGSGCTGEVALSLGRKCIGIELNPEYVKLAEKRCCVTIGLPLA
jgi:DNA modification methylase